MNPCIYLLSTVPDSLRIIEEGDWVYRIFTFDYMPQCFCNMSKAELLEFHEIKEWILPPLFGQHLIVDIINLCSMTPALRPSARELSEKIRQADQRLVSRSFKVVPDLNGRPSKPRGLEHLTIGECKIYTHFRNKGPVLENRAVQGELEEDALEHPLGYRLPFSEPSSAGGSADGLQRSPSKGKSRPSLVDIQQQQQEHP
ncbi:unnamed protein product, partial [Mesorhabditis spiculigera]